jgi:hypothetical protein
LVTGRGSSRISLSVQQSPETLFSGRGSVNRHDRTLLSDPLWDRDWCGSQGRLCRCPRTNDDREALVKVHR